jgi:hypothetical protein
MTANTIVHMVGSVPLDDAESVFRTLAETVGPHLKRLPDGETGRRRRWISFINDQLKENPAFEVDSDIPVFEFRQSNGALVYDVHRLKFKEGIDPKDVTFNTGYADDAIRNHAVFARLRDEGVIPAGVKYQICMATPIAVGYTFVSPRCWDEFLEVYMDHLADEFRRISDALPHEDISYQWDCCQEVLTWEGYYDQVPDFKNVIWGIIGRLGDLVPADMDLGYHLCYGSPADAHMVEPKDMAVLVEIANGLVKAVNRPIQYIHMPVPIERNDEGYFAPLAKIDLPVGTDLLLGCVHGADPEGNAIKLAKAQKYATIAGIGAECGVGRIEDHSRLTDILEQHRCLAEQG